MSAKAISEQTGKEFLYKYISTSAAIQNRFRYANVTAETDFDRLAREQPWLLTEVRAKDHEGAAAPLFLNVCFRHCGAFSDIRNYIDVLQTIHTSSAGGCVDLTENIVLRESLVGNLSRKT